MKDPHLSLSFFSCQGLGSFALSHSELNLDLGISDTFYRKADVGFELTIPTPEQFITINTKGHAATLMDITIIIIIIIITTTTTTTRSPDSSVVQRWATGWITGGLSPGKD
jgi:hypothetical protein